MCRALRSRQPGSLNLQGGVRSRRTKVDVMLTCLEILFLVLRPIPVRVAVMPAVINEDRIVPSVNGLTPEPRINARELIGGIVIIAKAIVVVSRIDEQVHPEHPKVHANPRMK